jgi:membrane-bound serine protease (ClpP class)
VPSAYLLPDIAFLLVIAGALAIYWELHAPGMIVPGVLGAALLLTGAWALSEDSPTWYGTALIILALVLLAMEIKIHTHMISGFVGSLALGIGAMLLIRGPQAIAPWIALSLSFEFGSITVFLGMLAMKARHNKRMVGEETLVGEIGSARTEINPEGTVLIRGEYWHARSQEHIPKGDRVYVTQVCGMEVMVKQLSG